MKFEDEMYHPLHICFKVHVVLFLDTSTNWQCTVQATNNLSNYVYDSELFCVIDNSLICVLNSNIFKCHHKLAKINTGDELN